MADILRIILGQVAPTLAGLVGGPLASTAVKALSGLLLGNEEGTLQDVTAAIKDADPEMLLKLKTLDAEFQTKMGQLGIDVEALANADRASARGREIATGDWTPRLVAAGTFLGFFGICGALAFVDIPTTNATALNMMLGALATGVASIWSYYFGSSSGSARKTEILGNGKA